jgi:hypothetical protein
MIKVNKNNVLINTKRAQKIQNPTQPIQNVYKKLNEMKNTPICKA